MNKQNNKLSFAQSYVPKDFRVANIIFLIPFEYLRQCCLLLLSRFGSGQEKLVYVNIGDKIEPLMERMSQ